MLVFKSDAHRLMFRNMLKLQIKSSILSRFGGLRQEECRIMKSKSFQEFLTLWANTIVNLIPKDPNAQSSYVKAQITRVSQEILDLPSVKGLMDEDSSLKWMIERINDDKENVPMPYFPSVLRNPMIQFPFDHNDIHKSRDLYGLLKFPFYKLSTSLHADSSETFKGLTEPGNPSASNQTTDLHTSGESQDSKANIQDSKFCSSNYIYSPSELETGLRDS